MAVDPVLLAQRLIRCPSVTPADAGALDVLRGALEPMGFACTTLSFGGGGTGTVHNLFARLGDGRPHFCFAGHTDVVPTGPEDAWSTPPFAGEVKDGKLWGRGAADMKGAVACFVAAVSTVLDEDGAPGGSISLLITGDEEGPALHGTREVLAWMAEHGHVPDYCVVGEPSNPHALGDAIKNGRRGSLTGYLTVRGTQGHVAYPALADNPVPGMVRLLGALATLFLDDGTDQFEPSNLEITTVDAGNPATNVIPGAVRATFNVRFNDRHTADSLSKTLRGALDAAGVAYELKIEVSGEAFVTPPGEFTGRLADAVESVTGRRPALSTAGGTSDARFIKDYCPVAEFGLVGQTMHKVDEYAAVADLVTLTRIYAAVLRGTFA